MAQRHSYEVTREIGLKILNLLDDELSEDELFAYSLAAIEMVKSAILGAPSNADEAQEE